MEEIPIRIFWRNYIHHLIHIEQNAITYGQIVVNIMAADEMFDF